jgi:kynurenine formamidase
MSRLKDLTHTFNDTMPVYPGDDAPSLTQIANIEEHGYNEYCYRGGFHVGTHIDAPLHMIDKGARISEIPVERYFGRGRLVDARNCDEVSAHLLDGVEVEPGDIVVVVTGWSKKFREEDYYVGFPTISVGFAEKLVELKVSILALDTPSPDHAPFPVHKILLGAGVLIIENLSEVEALTDTASFDIIALPAKFEWEGAPVRVVAQIET